MPIIGVRDNENNRSKRNAKKPKKTIRDRKEKGETGAIVKGRELNDFVVHLS